MRQAGKEEDRMSSCCFKLFAGSRLEIPPTLPRVGRAVGFLCGFVVC